ncbi:MAG TPA: sigma-70 family RNA polymerase sigma factor [Candidatus Baltobacteraceae bacterium]|jgi:RNA polymerase sigma-70 factor (ECF subfamily)
MVDPSAFELLYARYRPLVFGTALRVLRNPIEAEDVVQTIFLKAWLKPAAFRGGNIESWLTTVSKNCAIDVLRKRRHELGAIPIEMLRSSASAYDVEEAAILAVRVDRVRQAVSTLRSDQREVVMASFFDGDSHENIARTTALPLGTVKTRIRSGLMHLRRKAVNL